MNTFKKISKYLDSQSIQVIFSFLSETASNKKNISDDIEMEEEEIEEEEENDS
jgi:hypothetical protein